MKTEYIIAALFAFVLLGALWAVITGKLDDVHTEHVDAPYPPNGRDCICHENKRECDCVPEDYFTQGGK